MAKYPLSVPLEEALGILYDNPSRGARFLGNELAFVPSWDRMSTDPLERARHLRNKLEGYVVNMAAEVEELGDEELPRIQAEATATLIALRELRNHFPEAFK